MSVPQAPCTLLEWFYNNFQCPQEV
jgi:hypothetical protein